MAVHTSKLTWLRTSQSTDILTTTDSHSTMEETSCPAIFGDELTWTLEEEKSVVRKVDKRLMPLLTVCYFLQLCARTSLTASSVLGIIDNLNLTGNQYSWASSIFYFGFLSFTYPAAVIMVRFPIAKYLSVTIAIWAILIILHAACFNAAGLLAIRFFLGIAEAGCQPISANLVALFYTRSEQPIRQNIWFLGQGIEGILGVMVTWGMSYLQGAIPTWKYLFLLYGALTLLYSPIVWLALPSSPADAKFLSAREREIATARLSKVVQESSNFQMNQTIEALLDPQVWLITLYTLAVFLGNGGIGAFALLVVSGFGFDERTTLLMQMPIAAVQIIFITVGIFGSSIRNNRVTTMMFIISWSLIGMIMTFTIPERYTVARYCGFCLTTAYVANLPLALSLVTSNVCGHTKRSTALAMVFVGSCIGNICGPQFYIESEAPRYTTGLISALVAFGTALSLLVLLRLYYMSQNRKRSLGLPVPLRSRHSEEQSGIPLDEQTDFGDKRFMYAM